MGIKAVRGVGEAAHEHHQRQSVQRSNRAARQYVVLVDAGTFAATSYATAAARLTECDFEDSFSTCRGCNSLPLQYDALWRCVEAQVAT